MIRQFRWRIATAYSLLILIALTSIGLFLGYSFRQREFRKLETQIGLEARLLSQQSAGLFSSPVATEPLIEQVERWAETTGKRVTLIARDGSVIADSEQVAYTMDNHLDRPEIQQAIEQGEGKSIRFSRTQGSNHLYYAVAVLQDRTTLGFIRLSVPYLSIQRQLASEAWFIILTTLGVAALAIFLAIVIAAVTTRPLGTLAGDAHRTQDQDTDEIAVPAIPIEINQLARIINFMKHRLRVMSTDLVNERSKLSEVLNPLTDGVILVDTDGQVLLINPAAEKIFNVPDSEAVQRSVIQVLRNHQIVDLWRLCAKTGQSQAELVELTTKRLILHCSAAELAGEFSGYILLIFQDVTRLRQLETVRRDFISNISHELRTPLASLKAIAETLQDGALDDPQAAQRFLTSMETEVDALILMVQELVELSRIESGKVPLHLVGIHPKALLDSAVGRLSLQAVRGELSLEVDCPPGLPLVRADPPRMEQVVVNLLHNAIKFTPPGGKIVLSAKQAGEGVRFSVEDNGTGISSEDLPRIFERFFKADRARSSGGTGLGLAIARHLVEAHGGRIWAESIEGQGSTFFFILPKAS